MCLRDHDRRPLVDLSATSPLQMLTHTADARAEWSANSYRHASANDRALTISTYRKHLYLHTEVPAASEPRPRHQAAARSQSTFLTGKLDIRHGHLADRWRIPIPLAHGTALRTDQPSPERVPHRAQQPAGRRPAGAGQRDR